MQLTNNECFRISSFFATSERMSKLGKKNWKGSFFLKRNTHRNDIAYIAYIYICSICRLNVVNQS